MTENPRTSLTGSDQIRLSPQSSIRLHPLARQREGSEWIVGRIDTGNLIALPHVGVQLIALLDEGASLDETRRRLLASVGRPVNVEQFTRQLLNLGFVAVVDGVPVAGDEPRRPTLGWLHPHHVRWTQHPSAAWFMGFLVMAGLVRVVCTPRLLPSYHDLVWSTHGSLVLATTFVGGWTLLLLHESAHLVTARALGIPARIHLGTRLQFLVAQTDISGIELFPRRHRLTGYLAGVAVNLGLASAAVLTEPLFPSGGSWHRALAVLALLALVPLPFQLLVFMRTDLYFVFEDLANCRNLYDDGRAYLRYLLDHVRHLHGYRQETPQDPTRDLPRRERNAVRCYSTVLAAGTCTCLLVMATVTLPTDITLLVQAGERLGRPGSVGTHIDAGTVILILGGVQLLWITAKVRNRRRQRG
jgi:putative peptide zinc metalloprotease protein